MPLVTQGVQFIFDAAADAAKKEMADLEARAKKLGITVEELGKSSEQSGTRGKGLIQSLVGMINPLDIAAAGVGALVAVLKSANDAYGEAEVVQAQVNAVIQSTGGVAGVTAQEVDELSTRLSNLSGVDDEVISRGQAVMLTFTAIGDEVFPRATEAALNMSMAMGTDLQSSIMQVGKALNSPVEGASALRRVGVQLTDQQEEQIKAFMEVNDLASAQTIILDELEKEFGGVAEAMGNTNVGAANRLKVAWGDLLEQMGAGNAGVYRENVDFLTQILHAETDLISVKQLSAEAIERGLITQAEANRMENEAIFTARTLADVEADLNEILGNTTQQTEAQTAANLMLAQSSEEVATAQTSVTVSMDAVRAGIQGTISQAYDKYTETLAKLEGTHGELQSDLATLQAQGWQPSSEKVQELTSKLQENETAQLDASAAMDDAINKMIFQQAAADLDAQAQLELARAMGVLDEESYAVATRIEALKKSFQDGEITAEQYADAVAELRDRVDSLKDKKITITLDNIIRNTRIEMDQNQVEGHTYSGYQHGGIATGPNSGHWELLHGTEAVIPLQSGSIPVQLQGNGASGGGNVVVNVSIQSAVSLATQDEVDRVMLPAIENGVRLLKAEGKL